MTQVAVWGVAYLAIGGYSHHQVTYNIMLIQRNFTALQTRAVSQVGLRGVADIARDLQGVLVTSIICSVVYFKVRRRLVVLVGMVPLQVMMEAYEAYLDPLASMLYIVILIWTCVPLVRYSTSLMDCT